jgi:hypothetical protein
VDGAGGGWIERNGNWELVDVIGINKPIHTHRHTVMCQRLLKCLDGSCSLDEKKSF